MRPSLHTSGRVAMDSVGGSGGQVAAAIGVLCIGGLKFAIAGRVVDADKSNRAGCVYIYI